MVAKTPTDLTAYTAGQDYKLHGHKPGESIGVSIDQLVPAGGMVQSKRDLTSIGPYYECNGVSTSNANDPILASLYTETDPMGMTLNSLLNLPLSKGVSDAHKAMGVEPGTNDVLFVNKNNELHHLTAVSGYTAFSAAEAGWLGVHSTASRVYKLKADNNLVVVNSDSSERTITLSGTVTFPGAYQSSSADYVAHGNKIYKVDDASITEVLTAPAEIVMFAVAAGRLFYVHANQKDQVMDWNITGQFGGSVMTKINNNFSSLNTHKDMVFALEDGATSDGYLHFFNANTSAYSLQMLFQCNKHKNIIPASESAAVIGLDKGSTNTFHKMIRNSSEYVDIWDFTVDANHVNQAHDYVRIGDRLYIATGVDTGGTGLIKVFDLAIPAPDQMTIPFASSSAVGHKVFMRRG